MLTLIVIVFLRYKYSLKHFIKQIDCSNSQSLWRNISPKYIDRTKPDPYGLLQMKNERKKLRISLLFWIKKMGFFPESRARRWEPRAKHGWFRDGSSWAGEYVYACGGVCVSVYSSHGSRMLPLTYCSLQKTPLKSELCITSHNCNVLPFKKKIKKYYCELQRVERDYLQNQNPIVKSIMSDNN